MTTATHPFVHRSGNRAAPGPALALFLTGLLAALPGTLAAAVQPHAPILKVARDFLEQRLEHETGQARIRMGRLDSRLRLAACDGPLEAFLPAGGRLRGNTGVGVRCTGVPGWRIIVPARVTIVDEVLVTRRFIPRGAVLSEEHVVLAEREIAAGAQGYFTRLEDAVGQVLRHPIREGLVVAPAMLEPAAVVRRGDEVTILSRGGSFEVRMKGSALVPGAEGDRIRVRNRNSQRIVEGTVLADGTVVVPMQQSERRIR